VELHVVLHKLAQKRVRWRHLGGKLQLVEDQQHNATRTYQRTVIETRRSHAKHTRLGAFKLRHHLRDELGFVEERLRE
jgi:Holliday junction resolvase RusA-like endonuclease